MTSQVMIPDDINEIPPEVLYGVLKALNIEIGEYMYRLLNDYPRKIMIYTWVYKQYNNVEPEVEFVSVPPYPQL